MANSLCVGGLEPYVNPDCEVNYAGGIRECIIFIDELPTDPTDANEIQTLIDDDKAVLLVGLKIGITEPSPIEATSMRSCSPPSVTNYNRELSWIDANVEPGNVTFYNSLNAATGFEARGALLYECDAERCTFIDDPINFTGGRIVPDDNDGDPQHFAFTGKWKSKSDGDIYDPPGTIFGN
jgi:hypothetical protein